MDERFRIVFTGELRDHVQAEEVIAHLVATFKLPDARARALVLDGNRHVVKKDLDQESAQRYRSALEQAGMIVHVEPMAPAAEELSLALTNPEPSATTGEVRREPEVDVTNHNAAPRADLQPEPRQGEMRGPGRVPASHGWSWIVRGFWHFKTNPMAWILTFIVLIGISVLLSLIPFAGSLVPTLLGAVFTGGIMLGAREQDQGEDFRIAHLFAGFRDSFGQLALVGLLYLVAALLVGVLVVGALLGSMIPLMAEMDPATLSAQDPTALFATMGPMSLIALLVAALLFIPLAMSFLFAPALVILDELSAFEAMKLSFAGCLKNVLPFLVYGLAALVLLFVGMIPLGLGVLIVWPTLSAAIYVAYRDIFFEKEV